jgi:hypothetical protein
VSARVSISRRSALALADEYPNPGLDRALAELRSALRPRPVKALKKARREKTKEKRLLKKGATAVVRALVMERAGNRCECGCGIHFSGENWRSFANEAEMDHFAGRGRRESLESCWALTRHCHHNKTRNWPSTEHWLTAFLIHCERHGYAAEATKARNRFAFVQARSELGGAL